jgi:hypothetical protein
VTKPSSELWRVFWFYAVAFSICYQLLWGQVFFNWSAGDWFNEGYKTLLISKHASELFIYGFIVYWLFKRGTSDSQLALILSRGFFIVLLLITFNALLTDFRKYIQARKSTPN